MAEPVTVVDVNNLSIEVEYFDGYIESISYITNPPLTGPFVIENQNPNPYQVGLNIQVNYNFWQTVGHTVVYTPNGSDTDVSLAFHHYTDLFGEEIHSIHKIATINNYTYINLPPVARNDIFFIPKNQMYEGDLIADNGFGSDYDQNNDYIRTLGATIKTEHGTAIIYRGYGENQSGDFSYMPDDPNFSGEDLFEYTLEDSTGLQSTASVRIIIGENRPPIANDDAFSLEQDTNLIGNVLLDNGSGADNDIDGNPLTIVPGTFATANGNVTLSQFGTFSYTPNAGYSGPDSFEYTLEDGQGGTDTATVYFQINPQNLDPQAQNDSFSMLEDTILAGNVLADNGNGPDTDPNGDALHVIAQTLTTAKGGTAVLYEDGNFTYTPKPDFYGNDSFVYTVSDGDIADTAIVSIRIAEVADNYRGTEEDDRHVGGFLNDTLKGLGGDDVLIGGSGWDTLWGNEGDDTLYGGKGSDWMKGGAGADLFVLDGINFNRPDTIDDLRISKGDALQIRDILSFDALTDAITDFVRITQSGADSLLSVDVNGAAGGASFELAARIKGVTGLDVNQLFNDGDLIVSNAAV